MVHEVVKLAGLDLKLISDVWNALVVDPKDKKAKQEKDEVLKQLKGLIKQSLKEGGRTESSIEQI